MHFVGICFGEDWEDNLEYYSEDREVEPYIVYTKEEAIDYAKEIHAKIYENAIENLQNPNVSEKIKPDLLEIVEKGLFLSYEDAWKEIQDWGYIIDEDENLLSTYNEDSQWDWYEIGGRWDGYLVLKDGTHSNQEYFDNINWQALDKLPYCFITKGGEWYNEGFIDYIKNIKDNPLVTVIDFHV